MSELKSAFEAAWDKYLKGISKSSEFNDVLANAAITETQFYARERLAKNLIANRAAIRSSRFGHNGIIKGNPVGLMTTATLPTSNGINKADAILQQRMAKVAHSLPPTNFFPPAVIQSKALLPKVLRGMFHDEPSGVLDTDQIASDNIVERKLKLLENLRRFRYGTNQSGFARYAKIDSAIQSETTPSASLLKSIKAIAKSNPKIAKSLFPIAKAVGKASGLPIIGAFAKNPVLGAISAIIGGSLYAGSYSLGRSSTLAKWMNARAVTGDIGIGTFSGLAATGMSYEQMLQSLAKYSIKSSEARFGGGFEKYGELAKYGVDVSGLLNPYLSAEERRAEEYRVVNSANQEDRAAIMSALGMSPEEYRSEKLKNTPRSKWSLSDLQLDIYQGTTKKMKENHPLIDFFIPDKFYQLHSLLAANKELEDRKFFGDKAVDARREAYNLHKWDEVRDTAMVDDQYRAGMFDNSVTNNETNNGKSLTVINNWGGVSVEANDPVGFIEGLEAGVGNEFVGSHAVAEWFDSKRTK